MDWTRRFWLVWIPARARSSGRGGRYGFGQVLLAGGHLIVLTEKGDLALVKATPEGHQEVARFFSAERQDMEPSRLGRR